MVQDNSWTRAHNTRYTNKVLTASYSSREVLVCYLRSIKSPSNFKTNKKVLSGQSKASLREVKISRSTGRHPRPRKSKLCIKSRGHQYAYRQTVKSWSRSSPLAWQAKSMFPYTLQAVRKARKVAWKNSIVSMLMRQIRTQTIRVPCATWEKSREKNFHSKKNNFPLKWSKQVSLFAIWINESHSKWSRSLTSRLVSSEDSSSNKTKMLFHKAC